jgi:hypothetical protein
MAHHKVSTSNINRLGWFSFDVCGVLHSEAEGSDFEGKGLTLKIGAFLFQVVIAKTPSHKSKP